MSSAALQSANAQGRVGNLKTTSDSGKDGTLTDLWKRKIEKAAAPAQEPEEIDLVNDAPDTEDLPSEAVLQVTPVAPEAKEASPAAENNTKMEVDAPAVEQPAPAAEGNDSQDKERKRKRASKTPEQLAKLEELYAKDPFPSTDAKRECGTTIGLDLNAVNKWFEGRRRKQARSGEGPVKRGRPASAGKTEQTDAPAPAAAVPEEPKPAEETNNATQEKTADVEMTEAEASGPVSQPPATVTAPSAAKSTSKGAKTPAPELPSEEARVTLLANLTTEAADLRARSLSPPLVAIPAAGSAIEAFSEARLAEYVVGQRLPLTELVAALHPLFISTSTGEATDGSGTQPEGLTPEKLRSHIENLAVYKSYDPADKCDKDATAGASTSTSSSMWQWELKDNKILSKSQRGQAIRIKRRASKVGERLAAVVAAQDALEKLKTGSIAAGRVAKALEALKKHYTLEQIVAGEATELAAAAEKLAAKASQAAAEAEEKRKAREAEKEKIRLEKEAEKERLRLEKEEEKAKKQRERDDEKERQRLEKEKKLQETEAAKLVKKTGFKDKKALDKTRNKFESFFKAAPPAARASSAAPSPQAGPSPAEAAGAQIAATAAVTSPDVPQLSALERRWGKPPGEHLVPQPGAPPSTDKIDRALNSSTPFEMVQSDWKAACERVAATRRSLAAAPPSTIGLPPTWARRTGAIQAAAERFQELRESGVDTKAVRTWRRKFIYFQADSNRPPYYGSWPRPGPAVGPRRYLGKDETLDYDVMSDLEWEEEPEGSSLSKADDDDAGSGDDEDLEGSFMVPDGHLSEDEGIKSDDEMMDVDSGEGGLIAAMLAEAAVAAADGDAAPAAGVGGIGDGSRARATQVMQMMLERARRSGKPLVIMRQDVAERAERAGDGNTACINGDSAALEALALEVLIPGVSFTPAEDPAVAEAAAGAAGGAAGGSGAKQAGAGGPGRVKAERPDELLPALGLFIQQHASMSKPRLIDGFIEANSERKMSKKWVGEKITLLAERQGLRWTLRPEPLTNAIIGNAVEQQATQQQQAGADATPAPVAKGPLERLLIKPGVGTASKPTPTVPSALRPSAPPSTVKAPGRLVTTTAAGEAAIAAAAAQNQQQQQRPVLQPLKVPETVEGTGDEYWMLLLQHIEADTTTTEPTFSAAFTPTALAHTIASLPAFILDALLAAAQGHSSEEGPKSEAAVRCLRSAVEALASLENGASGHGQDASASQRAWGSARSGSHAASLAGLCREPGFVEVLQQCISNGVGAEHAVSMIVVLAKCPAVQEMSKESAEKLRESLVQSGEVAAEALKAWNALGAFASSA